MRRIWLEGPLGTRDQPVMTFDVSVGKGQIGRAAMIRSRQISPLRSFFRRIALVQKISVVDAVRVFFDESEYLGRRVKLAELEVLVIARIVDVRAMAREFAGITHHRVH